jgi:hypothetical protein
VLTNEEWRREREHFAGMALQGLLASPHTSHEGATADPAVWEKALLRVAERSWMIADAMIQVRRDQEKQEAEKVAAFHHQHEQGPGK